MDLFLFVAFLKVRSGNSNELKCTLFAVISHVVATTWIFYLYVYIKQIDNLQFNTFNLPSKQA